MPRKNTGRSRNSGSRRRRIGGTGDSPIDWERAEALHGGVSESERRVPRRTEPRSEKPRNEFTRNLTGFSNSALELMLRYGFQEVGEAGTVPVKFEGISKKPQKTIELTKPGVVISRSGLVVVSGVISNPDRNETGLGESGEIKRIGSEPELDSHNASNRFNVALGRQPEGIKEHELARALLGDSAISLSHIVEVNGHIIEPDADRWEVGRHWNLWEEPPSYGLGRTRFDTWDEPGPSGTYW